VSRPARAQSPRTPGARTAAARTEPARTGTARTATARTATARAATVQPPAWPSTDTGPLRVSHALHTSRAIAAPIRRTGPVAGRPQLRLVPPVRTPSRARRTETRSRRAPFVVLVVGLLVATTLGLLLLNTAIAVDSLAATRQRAANAEQAKQVAQLQQQVVDGSTAAARARAATEAGLVPAGAAAHLVLGPDGQSAVRGTASPAAPPAAPPGN
jgi:hypothetical protein